MIIKVYATLRTIVGGPAVHLDSDSEVTIAQILQILTAKYPELQAQLFDSAGELQRAIHILVNGRDVRHLDGTRTVVTAADEVRIFPPVGGGVQ